MVGESIPEPRQGSNLPFRPNNQPQNWNNGQNLNCQEGEDKQPSNPLPVMTREDQHQQIIKTSWDIGWIGIL